MAWLTLPDLIFSDIMMMVGLESLESLHRCRQVCRTWNEMILRDIWDSIETDIEKKLDSGMFPSEKEIMCGAMLAHNGLLGSLREITLRNVDLSPVSVQHLASLTSCVTCTFSIWNVSGCDLVSLFTSLKCTELYIWSQSLGREETWAMAQAMESRVEEVTLCEEVTLEVEALADYSGQGRCRDLRLFEDTAEKYRQELKTWARSRNWWVSWEDGSGFSICP